MNTGVDQSWWESLRHFGLLLSVNEVRRVEREHLVDEMPFYGADQLRRERNRLDAEQIAAGDFVAWVLENICGFKQPWTGTWKRASAVPASSAHVLVSGESVKPRHLWTGKKGGALPVFIDRHPTLGLGRSRRTLSDVVQWLRIAKLPAAVVSNARQWRLVHAGLDFDAACEWDADLWFEEGTPGRQLQALRLLLQPDLFEPEEEGGEVRLAAAISASRKGQAELSSVLGGRVREAVEALVRAHGEALTSAELEQSGPDIYRAAVRMVMRMVVVLFAESRDLLPRSSPLYHQGYGLQALFEQLQRVGVRGRGRLAHRFGAWPRVLALFRLIYEGSHHEALQIPRYGGDLFAPGGCDATDPLRRALHVFETACFDTHLNIMPDAVVHRMLELLTRTLVRVRQGRSSTSVMMPVDFSDLSSEYIGILYEGLLDYELRTAPADGPILFLAVGDEPALPISRLEAMDDRQVKDLFEKLKEKGSGEEDAEEPEEEAEEIEEETDVEEPADGEGDAEIGEPDDGQDHDAVEAARARALAWTQHACVAAGLVKKPRGRMTPEKQMAFERKTEGKARQLVRRVVLPGEWYLVRWGGTRKGAGTFYTRPQLAVPTVQRTLRPLAYQPEGEDWRPKKPEEILAIKVCDPACGSGSFPVAAFGSSPRPSTPRSLCTDAYGGTTIERWCTCLARRQRNGKSGWPTNSFPVGPTTICSNLA